MHIMKSLLKAQEKSYQWHKTGCG